MLSGLYLIHHIYFKYTELVEIDKISKAFLIIIVIGCFGMI